MEIKKGDIVGRISYNKDILFYVKRIIKVKNGKSYAILRGIQFRIEADAPLEDLEKIEKDQIDTEKRCIEKKITKRIAKSTKDILFRKNKNRGVFVTNALILHLDGDRRYTQKSQRYYNKLGLRAIVKNVPENRQPQVIGALIRRYNPDIVVITGHDGMIKSGDNYNDIYNYRNSRYFIKSVIEARKNSRPDKDIVIFAGACQSFFEAIIASGANFASSPARVLIDFMDPLVVAEKVAITDKNKIITTRDITAELHDEGKRVGGRFAKGKKET